jgi:hypothetical protein
LPDAGRKKLYYSACACFWTVQQDKWQNIGLSAIRWPFTIIWLAPEEKAAHEAASLIKVVWYCFIHEVDAPRIVAVQQYHSPSDPCPSEMHILW